MGLWARDGGRGAVAGGAGVGWVKAGYGGTGWGRAAVGTAGRRRGGAGKVSEEVRWGDCDAL